MTFHTAPGSKCYHREDSFSWVTGEFEKSWQGFLVFFSLPYISDSKLYLKLHRAALCQMEGSAQGLDFPPNKQTHILSWTKTLHIPCVYLWGYPDSLRLRYHAICVTMICQTDTGQRLIYIISCDTKQKTQNSTLCRFWWTQVLRGGCYS